MTKQPHSKRDDVWWDARGGADKSGMQCKMKEEHETRMKLGHQRSS